MKSNSTLVTRLTQFGNLTVYKTEQVGDQHPDIAQVFDAVPYPLNQQTFASIVHPVAEPTLCLYNILYVIELTIAPNRNYILLSEPPFPFHTN